MTTGKTIALTIGTFVGKVTSLLFHMLFRFAIAFLPRSRKQVCFLRVKHRRKTLTTECFVFIPLSSHCLQGHRVSTSREDVRSGLGTVLTHWDHSGWAWVGQSAPHRDVQVDIHLDAPKYSCTDTHRHNNCIGLDTI